MNWEDEDIIAYVDGEMPAGRAGRLETDMAADPGLAGRVERQRVIANRVRSEYAPVANENVPERFTTLLDAGDTGAAAGNLPGRLKEFFTRPLATQGIAAMASLALGLFVGARFLAPDPGISGQSVIANARLAEALDAPGGNEAWQMPVTFRDNNGRYCRAFQGGEAAARGLACRASEGWRVQLLMTDSGNAATGYQLAGSSLPPALLEAIDGLIDGEPLDPESIETAAAADWME